MRGQWVTSIFRQQHSWRKGVAKMWNVDFHLEVILFSFHKSETMLSQSGNSLLMFIPYLIVCPTKNLSGTWVTMQFLFYNNYVFPSLESTKFFRLMGEDTGSGSMGDHWERRISIPSSCVINLRFPPLWDQRSSPCRRLVHRVGSH